MSSPVIAVRTHRLANGLRLLHHYDASTQMVAVNLLFDVGSRDESAEHTGLAHLIEHLMFTGSAHAPRFDAPLQAAGGVSNAFTSQDITNFYETLPAQNIETALWLESDRLMSLNLNQTSIDTQKSVVIEEFKQRCLNQPYGDLGHLSASLCYKVHPYRWPVIGLNLEQISQMPTQVIADFHHAHYAVNNAILCIAGQISYDRAVEMTEKWFADIAPHEVPLRQLPQEPEQTEPRLLAAKRPVPDNIITLHYHMCSRTDAAFAACDQLSDVLGNGLSSRLYRNVLKPTGLFTSLDAAVLGTRDPGLFKITGVLAHGATFSQARCAIEQELQRLISDGVAQYEHQKYTNKFESTQLFQNIGYADKALTLCRYALLGDVQAVNTEVAAYQKLTTHMLQQEAQRLFRPENCCALYYGPDA